MQRNKQPVTLKLVLARRPDGGNEADRAWELIGLQLSRWPQASSRRYQSQYRGGLLVTAVRPDSPPLAQGIRRATSCWACTSGKRSRWTTSPTFSSGRTSPRSQPLKFSSCAADETLLRPLVGRSQCGVKYRGSDPQRAS